MNIRTATIKDLEAVTSVEAECFPPAEAATREELAERLKYYADRFWLMFDGDKLIAFVDGFVTDEEDRQMRCMQKLNCTVKVERGR